MNLRDFFEFGYIAINIHSEKVGYSNIFTLICADACISWPKAFNQVQFDRLLPGKFKLIAGLIVIFAENNDSSLYVRINAHAVTKIYLL